MSVSPDDTKEDKLYLSEEQERLLNHHILTPGYIRNLTSNDMNSVPEAIVKLCTEFVKPIIFEREGQDPVNFISDSDKVKCEQYKLEGNRYFKAKSFQFAITKYTVAVRYDPNNHLIFSNRSYCHYLLGNYDDALSDIKECVRIQPAFVKGWFRYGLILEKLEHFGEAGMAYKTAFNLSQYEMEKSPDDEAKKRPLMLCKHRYLKFMKMLKRENKEDALKYISDFGSNYKMMTPEQEKKFMNEVKSGAMSSEELLKMEISEFVRYVEESRFRQCAEENKFQFCEGEKFAFYNRWNVGWSSTECIENNKRAFTFTLCAEEWIMDGRHVFGRPTAKQVIEILLRAMTFTQFAPMPAMKCIKPRMILFSWRMRDAFAEIQAAMIPFGIHCHLQNRRQTEYYCELNGTRVDGYNHLAVKEADK